MMRGSVSCASLLLLSLLPSISAYDIQGRIAFNNVLPESTGVPVGSKVSLDHGARYAYITPSGSFDLSYVPEGQHILEGFVPGYIMESFLVTINETIHIQPYHVARAPLPLSVPSFPHPIQMKAFHKEDYFTSPPSFQLLAMLKNPMVLLMIFSGIMMFGLPKLNEMLDADPQLAAEVAAARKKMMGGGGGSVGLVESISNSLQGDSDGGASSARSDRASTPSRNNNKGAQKRRGK
ncbi:hypothetical protein BD324DRAFT_628397 [Kockovaella imperatae]|uniref:ER membrane protein complex subunit 7 beta-sandwich domain-containing protein n=1 Tax=Kockovaella imperatae TaxID=4999 RepID=A0A1Y1UEB7_9TREE|nr:hypothetical protein BD324DRAFT_628397 [Kockovaella imperatae]ORX36339.1 hypothetical protein BD324DRAFT_628397 [Kockovaella imperatae]